MKITPPDPRILGNPEEIEGGIGPANRQSMGVFGKMKTLLRKIPTGLYFQAPDRWTNDPWEASDFGTIDKALEFVQASNLTEMEMAFAFSRAGDVKTVPLERITARYSPD